MLRLFVAVDLPSELRSEVEGLMGQVHNARWANPAQLHITLRFMGDTPDDALPSIRQQLGRVKQECFRLQLRGLGVFPEGVSGKPRKPPKVLWIGIEPTAQLLNLKRSIDAELGAGLAQKPFSPHLTLARFPRPPDDTLSTFLADRQRYRSPRWPVTSFHLYRSTLRPEGAVHAMVATYPLAPNPEQDQT